MHQSIEDLSFLAPILGDDTRRRVFSHILQAPGGVTAADISQEFAIHRTVARLHLEKLARSNLVLRSPVRSGASGRPAACYRARPEHLARNGPAQQPSILTSVLVKAISRLGEAGLDSVQRVCSEVAGGRQLAGNHPDEASICRELEDAMASIGRPGSAERSQDGSTITVSTLGCPFNALSFESPEVICTADEHLIGALVSQVCGRHGLKAESKKEDTSIRPATELPNGKSLCELIFTIGRVTP